MDRVYSPRVRDSRAYVECMPIPKLCDLATWPWTLLTTGRRRHGGQSDRLDNTLLLALGWCCVISRTLTNQLTHGPQSYTTMLILMPPNELA